MTHDGIKLEDCPFCGHIFSEQDLEDSIYPTNRSRDLWQCGCVICTATVYGKDANDAVNMWNNRIRKLLH